MKSFTKCLPYILIIIFLMTAPLFASIVSDKGLGKQKVLVIMVKFPDVQPSFSREKMREKYFGKLDRYLQAISYKKTWIEGKMTDWYLLPNNVGHYHLSQHNLEVEQDRVTKLIQDAINLADEDEDFSQYSMIFLSLGAKRKDYGMMGLCGYPGMLGWQNQLPMKTNGKSKTLNLGPLSSGKSEVQVVKLPINSTTYYLIENRLAIGHDKNLPSHGVLIYYCDDRIAECRHGKSPVKLIDADPSIPQLKGAPFTCDGNRSFNDEKHNISIKLVSQNRESFKIFVSNK